MVSKPGSNPLADHLLSTMPVSVAISGLVCFGDPPCLLHFGSRKHHQESHKLYMFSYTVDGRHLTPPFRNPGMIRFPCKYQPINGFNQSHHFVVRTDFVHPQYDRHLRWVFPPFCHIAPSGLRVPRVSVTSRKWGHDLIILEKWGHSQ